MTGWILPGTAMAAEDPGVAHFEENVLPLLRQHCYQCHSHESKIKGGLVLDSRSGWQTGGDSGPAIIAGKPDSSLLLEGDLLRR